MSNTSSRPNTSAQNIRRISRNFTLRLESTRFRFSRRQPSPKNQEDKPTWKTTAKALTDASLTWQQWLGKHFPHVTQFGFADRHVRLWEWIEALRQGERAKSFIAVWPRGGAKSTTTELATVRLCEKLTRRFVLYVSETQDQADKHVQAIASLLERRGVERAVNQYGNSRGWKRQELRTANGFNVAAFGLDTGARGVKLDEFRPDLIVLDDIDGLHDTTKATQKKQDIITSTLLPAGSFDCAVLFVQNRIHEFSLISQIADGTADFLHNREPVSEEPAIVGLEIGTETLPDGTKRYRITGGVPTWEGQSLAACEELLNTIGERAFRRESQHEVEGAQGIFFDVSKINWIEAEEVPTDLRKCRAWDLAATESGGDHTVGILQGHRGDRKNPQVYVLDCVAGQWESTGVRQRIRDCREMDGPKVALHLPQDPGQAGKDQAVQFRTLFPGAKIEPVSGDKATRATGFQDAMNKGNVYCVRAPWNAEFRRVLKQFRENENDQEDDYVDAAADGYNELQSGGWATNTDALNYLKNR